MNVLERIMRKIYRVTSKSFAWIKMNVIGVQFLKPNYVFFARFDESSVIIDVGCGHEAEFSQYLIKQYNVQAFGVDPTRKHAPFLTQLEQDTQGRFRHLALAVTQEDGYITFHESKQNESGSILLDHRNVKNDDIIKYQVESVGLRELVRRTGSTTIDFMKLDLEGAEYELLGGILADIDLFKQIFVEFHHHCTDYSIRDTKAVVKNIRGKGFKAFTLDQQNYLFYK